MDRWRIATYNLRRGFGRDSVYDLQRTARVLRKLDADLIGLQEVDRGLRRSGYDDQPARLEELSGLRLKFWPLLTRGDGEYGIAVAARAEVDARFEPLPRLGSEEPRGVIVARLDGLTVLATHLSRQRPPRAAQTTRLAALAGAQDGPVMVVGDLNQTRAALAPLVDAGFDPGPRRATMGGRQIDFVLAGPGLRILGAATVATPASDHLPLVADVARARGV